MYYQFVKADLELNSPRNFRLSVQHRDSARDFEVGKGVGPNAPFFQLIVSEERGARMFTSDPMPRRRPPWFSYQLGS